VGSVAKLPFLPPLIIFDARILRFFYLNIQNLILSSTAVAPVAPVAEPVEASLSKPASQSQPVKATTDSFSKLLHSPTKCNCIIGVHHIYFCLLSLAPKIFWY
jgi:hypothetical protein